MFFCIKEKFDTKKSVPNRRIVGSVLGSFILIEFSIYDMILSVTKIF